ncbi:alpha/beta hydrolase fold domain-containing protein [Klenkia sp. PcliD-1-E]|uniref:alpha/beta hydrolase fold domain-containing protein n=1 Tax=Klenkia sp. PcliD-1-E TaxID=2954492 RepID=UPI0020970AB9|nr:alpha/beta hydrolase fold domain-containing protein [Klenkia sp. PcliD-1-E]MCO7220720.1 alpha/beta hydrolase [Klenkia sp. PcliD-1-E]
MATLPPDLTTLADQLGPLLSPPAREVGLEAARERFDRLLARGLAGAPDVPVSRVDLGGGLAADRYAPPGAGGATVVFLHGGGWTLGTAASYGGLAARLAAGLSAVVLAVEFRRAPEHPFPAAVEDAVAAVRWALAEAADPDRVVVAGDSGGGNLAAVACQQLRAAGGPQPAAQLLLYPSVAAGADWPSVDAWGTSPFLSLSDMGFYTRSYLPRGVPLTDPRISPLEAADLAGLPPALLVTAELDALRDSGRAYAAALAGAGVPVTALDLPGVPHGFAHLVALHEGCAAALDRVLTAARGLSVFG